MTTETGTEGEVNAAVEQANFNQHQGRHRGCRCGAGQRTYLFTLTGAAGVGLLLTLRRRHQK
ncbi:MAG: hypothetical protein ACLVJH_10110 [Faecalibacterium prausnitzii]